MGNRMEQKVEDEMELEGLDLQRFLQAVVLILGIFHCTPTHD